MTPPEDDDHLRYPPQAHTRSRSNSKLFTRARATQNIGSYRQLPPTRNANAETISIVRMLDQATAPVTPARTQPVVNHTSRFPWGTSNAGRATIRDNQDSDEDDILTIASDTNSPFHPLNNLFTPYHNRGSSSSDNDNVVRPANVITSVDNSDSLQEPTPVPRHQEQRTVRFILQPIQTTTDLNSANSIVTTSSSATGSVVQFATSVPDPGSRRVLDNPDFDIQFSESKSSSNGSPSPEAEGSKPDSNSGDDDGPGDPQPPAASPHNPPDNNPTEPVDPPQPEVPQDITIQEPPLNEIEQPVPVGPISPIIKSLFRVTPRYDIRSLIVTPRFNMTFSYPGNYGLQPILGDDDRLSSTEAMQNVYHCSTARYFALDDVYRFTDTLKDKIAEHDTYNNDIFLRHMINRDGSVHIGKFAEFLTKDGRYQPRSSYSRPATGKYNALFGRPNRSALDRENTAVIVATKNGKLDIFYVDQSCKLNMKRGDIIMCQSDRGFDLVCIVEPHAEERLAALVNFLIKKAHFDALLPPEQIHDNKTFVSDFIQTVQSNIRRINIYAYKVKSLQKIAAAPRIIPRFATVEEVSEGLQKKYVDELRVLHAAKMKLHSYNKVARYTHGTTLTLRLLNAEYQFDRGTVTINYITTERNNFKPLTSDLFKLFNTRVWFNALPCNLKIEEKYFRKNAWELRALQAASKELKFPPTFHSSTKLQDGKQIFAEMEDYNFPEDPDDNFKSWINPKANSGVAMFDKHHIGTLVEATKKLFNKTNL